MLLISIKYNFVKINGYITPFWNKHIVIVSKIDFITQRKIFQVHKINFKTIMNHNSNIPEFKILQQESPKKNKVNKTFIPKPSVTYQSITPTLNKTEEQPLRTPQLGLLLIICTLPT